MCGQSSMLRPNVLCVWEQLGAPIGTSKPIGGMDDRSVRCKRVAMSIHEFGMHNIDKDELISKFEEEVSTLKRKNEMQSVYLVGGFESVLRVKDEEKKRLALENAELRRTVTILEEQLVDQVVHNATQWFNGGNVGHEGIVGGMSGCGDNAHGGQQRCTLECLDIVLDASLVSFVLAAFHHIESGVAVDVVQCAKLEVVVVCPLMAESGWASGGPNSFVRKIKVKVRKNLQLLEFEYLDLWVRQWKVNSEGCMFPPSIAGSSTKHVIYEKVIDVDSLNHLKKLLSPHCEQLEPPS